MSIEIVVRPASAISVLRKQSVKPATASEDNEAVIEWGNGPLGLAERTNVNDTWDGGGGGSGPSNMHILDETVRRTHVVRVYNPDNLNIWVDVEVIDSL